MDYHKNTSGRQQCPNKLEQLRRIERTRFPGTVEGLLRRRDRKL